MRGKQDHSRERHLRRDQTEAESLLWRHLRNRLLKGHKFRRQHAIDNYIADLVCDEAKLMVGNMAITSSMTKGEREYLSHTAIA